MKNKINNIKGTHPGIILEKELQKREISKSKFALSIDEYPQTLGAVTKGKRRINVPLALKIEKELGFEEGYFSILQIYYDIEQEKEKLGNKSQPNLSKIRPIIFQNMDLKNLDWDKKKQVVIKRVFEKGNLKEVKEITSFYGKEEVLLIIKKVKNLSPSAKKNITKVFP